MRHPGRTQEGIDMLTRSGSLARGTIALVLLAAATSADTLSNRNCTDTNCLYGPPLPVVSDISTCVINNVAQPAVGSARCDTGSVTQSLPLTSNVYLTFDLFPADGGGQDHCVGGTAAGSVCTH